MSSTANRQSGFILLRELVAVLHGGLNDTHFLFVPLMKASLASGTPSPASTKKGHKPINNLIQSHPPDPFRCNRNRRNGNLDPTPQSPHAAAHILAIYHAVLERVKVANLDILDWECSILALSTLFAETYKDLPRAGSGCCCDSVADGRRYMR
ncbi:hypothetical protein HDU98_006489 [Podochytrium sp. JEL0797]|nr:hypothetical protein HDU98_006489 [Podochytrium sp. JEL0797]